MSQIPILNGIYADPAPDVRTSYPRNYVPVPKSTGVAQGYLKPADGLMAWGAVPPGIGRGGIVWNGSQYRVMGTKLVQISATGSINVLGDVGGSGQVTIDYGFDRLAIASNNTLWYWNGSLTSVPETLLPTVLDVKWIGGYYVTTDGTNIIVTDLDNPLNVNPLKYGSAESSPDALLAIDELRDEMYALGRYTIQVFQNVGGNLFPFQDIPGATVPKGIIGTHAYTSIGNTFVFIGSGFNEAPAVYMMVPGDTVKLSTREIDRILMDYTEAELSQAVAEVRVTENHQWVLFHLPDQCLVYDTIGTKVAGEPLWFTLDSGTLLAKSAYRGRNFLWCYGQWCCEDPTTPALAQATDTVSTHFGQSIGWSFGTQMLYNEGNDATVLEMELVSLPGRVPLGAAPVVWTSHSLDGETWSNERPVSAGKQGERNKRLAWRNQGRIHNVRMQRFRGTSDAHLPVLRLEAKMEPLYTRPGSVQPA